MKMVLVQGLQNDQGVLGYPELNAICHSVSVQGVHSLILTWIPSAERGIILGGREVANVGNDGDDNSDDEQTSLPVWGRGRS